ncbi:secretion protein HlyD [Leptospira perolatii]|uniref:Secretion protein HlyD n=1 Tax=Leptospira perolatii TaxID=2023191 RepID=A0A2M9ZM30_9LEPT|nr:efflux RND transporter periplasmic adaptor subunit [Leptospira perolatii]PJZ69720.1 secretion protein HlyD [Leptospira perolatii]PJZ73065.1 secretion protein HlyD [Leptospira perolatii]
MLLERIQFIQQKPRVLLLGLLIFIVLLFALFSILRKPKERVVEVINGSLIDSVYGLATVNSSQVYHLRVAIPSTLRKIYVEEGDRVSRGAPLVEFDSFGRMNSPIDGVVTNIAFELNESVVPQVPILTVTDLQKRYLLVSLEEKGAVKVRRGQSVRIRFEALGDKMFKGKVKSIYPAEGQFQVHIVSDFFPDEILPGMTADVAIETSLKENVTLVPISGIKSGKIRVLEKGKVSDRQIQIGSSNGEYAELLSGDIKEGDQVLVSEEN